MNTITGIVIVLGMLITAAVATIFIQEWSKVQQAKAVVGSGGKTNESDN